MKKQSLLANRNNRGMTIIEVVVAIAIAAMVSLGMYASAIYTKRQTVRNLEHIYALQIVNSAAAKVRAARYDRLTGDPDEFPVDAFEKQFFSPQTILADPNSGRGTTYSLTYKLKGYGKGFKADAAGSSHIYDLKQPQESATWGRDEYKGHLLVVTAGKGANQVMHIISNNATREDPISGEKTVKVRLTKNFDGTGNVGFDTPPGESSSYAVDYGLYCEVTVSWDDGKGFKTVTETVYVATD